MNRELVPWLLRYPIASGISQLAVDAHLLGYVDFPQALGIAIASNLRREVVGGGSLPVERVEHGLVAEAAVDYRRRCGLRLERGTILFIGAFTLDAAVSQSCDNAALYVRGELPETLLTAAPGRDLSDIVDADLFASRRYIVQAVHRHRRGLSFAFKVPRLPFDEWVDAGIR